MYIIFSDNFNNLLDIVVEVVVHTQVVVVVVHILVVHTQVVVADHNLVGHNQVVVHILVELLLSVHNLVLNHILLLPHHEDHDVHVVHDDHEDHGHDGHVVQRVHADHDRDDREDREGPFLVGIDHIGLVGHKDHSLLAVERKDLGDRIRLGVDSNFGWDCFGNLDPFI